MAGIKTSLLREIKAAFRETERQMIKAQVAATNKAANTAVSRTIKAVTKTYNIKQKDLRAQVSITKANKNYPSVRIMVSHKGIPLMDFKPKPNTVAQYTRPEKGVSVEWKRGKRQIIKHSFIAKMKSGHTGVFLRKGKKRLPIKETFGPSAMQLFKTDEAEKNLEEIFYERYKIELERAIKHFVK
jgi:hypothetical protein